MMKLYECIKGVMQYLFLRLASMSYLVDPKEYWSNPSSGRRGFVVQFER